MGPDSSYCSFIPCGCLVASLTDLLQKVKEIVWTEVQEATSTMLIGRPNCPRARTTRLQKTCFMTDALAVILPQQAGKLNKHQVIACYSNRFTPREQRHAVHKKGPYGARRGVKKYRHYLYQRFTLKTDQHVLMHLTASFQDGYNGRVARRRRWSMQYDYVVKCTKAITSVVADVPS